MIGRIVPRTALTQLQQEQMLGLMRQHFFGVTAPQFQADLEQKNWVILIEDGAGRLRGFSTLLYYTPQIDEGRLHAVYSGDTIVDAGARHDPTLARTWIAAVNQGASINRCRIHDIAANSASTTANATAVAT